MKSEKRKITGSVFILLAVLFSLHTLVFAAAKPPDLEKTGSITLKPHSINGDHSVVKGTQFTLYQAAAVRNNGGELSYSLTEDFSGSKADLSDLEASGLAQTLADYAQKNNLTGTVQKADSSGTVRYEKLSLGVYLLVQADSGDYSARPFLVTIPAAGEDGETWVYDVDASPKMEVTKLTDISVKKVWNDGKSENNRPDSVSVTLYRENEEIETVRLNGSNNWSYTWDDLPESDAYTVKEKSVSGYQASYSQSGNTFTITNTIASTKKTGNSSKLVQTGQLNWPIPVLAAVGLVLFAVGWSLVFLKRKSGKTK